MMNFIITNNNRTVNVNNTKKGETNMKNIKRFVAFILAAVMTLNVAGFNNNITVNATSTCSTPNGDLKTVQYTHVTNKELNSLCTHTKKYNKATDRDWHKYSNNCV